MNRIIANTEIIISKWKSSTNSLACFRGSGVHSMRLAFSWPAAGISISVRKKKKKKFVSTTDKREQNDCESNEVSLKRTPSRTSALSFWYVRFLETVWRATRFYYTGGKLRRNWLLETLETCSTENWLVNIFRLHQPLELISVSVVSFPRNNLKKKSHPLECSLEFYSLNILMCLIF